jgi:hypothetical protein
MGGGRAYISSDHPMLRIKYKGSNQLLSFVDHKLRGMGITEDK